MSGNVVLPSYIRKKHLPYIAIWIVYYAWVIVFTTWWTASPSVETVFGADIRGLLHSINLLSSAVFVLVIKKEWFIHWGRTGAVVLIVFMVLFMALSRPLISLVCIVLIGISLGFVNCSILIPFVFTLNNTEKFYAVVGSYLLINLFSLFPSTNAFSNLAPDLESMIFSFFILCAGLSAVLFFDKADAVRDDAPAEAIPRRVYLTILINVIFAMLYKGIGTGILDMTLLRTVYPLRLWSAAGGLAGCVIYILIYAYIKKSIHMAWNITFSTFAIGMFFNAFSDRIPEFAVVFAVLFGIGSTIGMINMYYILGVIGKKYKSLRYVRYSIIFIGVSGGVAGIVFGSMISKANLALSSIIVSVATVCVMTLFLLLSPILSRGYYEDAWVSDSERPEVNDPYDIDFSRYKLSKREIEVCRLLLKGFTLRQISSIINIAYPTVNTYCTSLYRKLGINSRTELILLFKEFAEVSLNK